MVSRPPVQCPLCHSVVSPKRCLEDHLVEKHTGRELAKSIVAEYEVIVGGDPS
ncbi:hypothetical protein [Natronobeatus ordinarius]|uniref:hypothetical protein n=1 Tax=Natronobeatus ordinarius TaxID=2963433 RepID=UPI0020CCF9DF|nr:hypothetical protein [Natronobeatus ordinarius]